MTKTTDFSGFGHLVPGFDFLQSLTQGASQGNASIPGLSGWVTPTLNVEELDKRINELKTVHFWLDQNTKAVAATVQALEVQKMTLGALKGLNLSVGDLANAFKLPETPASPPAPAAPVTAPTKPARRTAAGRKADTPASAGVVDPLQWWNALGSQFQTIATNAMKDMDSATAKTSPRKKPASPTAKAASPGKHRP
jgi:hypothetical protein